MRTEPEPGDRSVFRRSFRYKSLEHIEFGRLGVASSAVRHLSRISSSVITRSRIALVACEAGHI